ncbi:MAG: aspartate carbamoyltransferase catalytic subunit [Rhizobacter sp.]|nr:aspartate carbamoyltransferase catalytic subunit [Chlorobiales bacterium]
MRHLTGLYQVPAQTLHEILHAASVFKPSLLQSPPKLFSTLAGKTVVNLFFENSTRTRTSFELAERRLGASSVNFAAAQSSTSKGESLLDTVANIEAMQVDAYVIRHPHAGAAELLTKHTQKPVINAGDGQHEHPTQALLDIFTLQETFEKLSGLRVLILGDILHSRVARSNIFGLQTLGAKVSLCAPPTLLPREIHRLGVTVFTDIREAIRNCDAVNVLRIQLEREAGGFIPSLSEYHRFYGLTEEAVAVASKKIFILHPGPINREIEISSSVADRFGSDAQEMPQAKSESLILRQVTNGVAVRMAVLHLLLSSSPLPSPN